jgi:hypothetical protein
MDEPTQKRSTKAQPSLRSDGQWWVERDDGWYFFDQAGQRWVKQGEGTAGAVGGTPAAKPEAPPRGTWPATVLRSKLLLVGAGLVLFLLGVGIGSVGTDDTAAREEAAEAQDDVAQLEAELAREEDARESAAQRAEELDEQVSELRSEVAALERELEEPKDSSPDSGGGGGGSGDSGSGGGGSASSALRSFGDGTWRVGEDVQPGTYRAPGGQNCYWERLRNFKAGLNSIIANGGFTKNQTVTIAASDAGFSTRGCGTWQPL